MKDIDIVIVEDDNDYYRLARNILIDIIGTKRFLRVSDGEELLLLLRNQGRYTDIELSTPKLILLDLNMPKMSGLEALKRLRSDGLKAPVVIMTASTDIRDIELSYKLGANSYILKGSSFAALETKLRNLCSYWLETVELPPRGMI